MIHNFEDMA